MGDRTLLCGTPDCISVRLQISPATVTLNILFDIKKLIFLTVLTKEFYFSKLYNKGGCYAVSKDFSISANTATVERLLLNF